MFKKILVGSAAVLTATVSQASAAVSLTGVVCDVAPVEALTATVLVGLGVMWGIRKLIKTINRS